MQDELFLAVPILWALAFVTALLDRTAKFARIFSALGCIAAIAICLMSLPGSPRLYSLGFDLADTPVQFHLDAAGCWLLLFGLLPAFFATCLGTTGRSAQARAAWQAGFALTLLGALGVLGFQDAMSFLVAWEVMSIGGAVMILGERVAEQKGGPVLFMLALLEVGTVAILLALLLMGTHNRSFAFSDFGSGHNWNSVAPFLVGLLLLFGFGAKLGVLPFYEWFPAAYGVGSGATGVVFSGVVLNAAFYALARGMLSWLPRSGSWIFSVAIITTIAGVLSAILTILNAFQEEDWRRMLSLSSAENAGIAVATLGVSLLLETTGRPGPAGLAWTVCMLHLAGHSLAKSALFLTADSVRSATDSYLIRQTGVLRNAPAIFGIGALFAAMSLAALPPQAGFVSEWYVFQTLFQGMQMNVVSARLTIALAAAGLALVAAVALATFAKLFGIGLLGDGHNRHSRLSAGKTWSIFLLGAGILALAVGMPWWIFALGPSVHSLFGVDVVANMKDGWLLVPLSSKFAFISPSKLIIAGPLLAMIPLTLFLASQRSLRYRRVPVWSGGRKEDPRRIATTSLAFSNALRTFYGFIYGPTHNLEREYDHGPYFVKRLIFNQEVAPIFGPLLFAPLTRLVKALADRVSRLQSGYLNFYNALIGMLLILILALTLFYG